MLRRQFLRVAYRAAAAISSHLLTAKAALAAWPASLFAAGDFTSQFQRAYGEQAIRDSDAIRISLPEIAENGAVVPITVSSDLSDIQRLYLWVEKNPTPLAAEIELDASLAVYLTARIKMAESSHVTVIARQGENLLRNRRWVKVMQGGCGTG